MILHSMSPSETVNSLYSYDTLITDKVRFYMTATVCAGLVNHQNRGVLPDNFTVWTGGHNITLARNQVSALSEGVDERSACIIAAYTPIVEKFSFLSRNEWMHQKEVFIEIRGHDHFKGLSDLSVAFATGYLTMPTDKQLGGLIERFDEIKNRLGEADGFTDDDFLLIASCIPPGHYRNDKIAQIPEFMEKVTKKLGGKVKDRPAIVMLVARFLNHLGESEDIMIENIDYFLDALLQKFPNISDLEKAMLVAFPMPTSLNNTSPKEVGSYYLDTKLDIIKQIHGILK